MGSLKTEERITKTPAEPLDPMPPTGRKRWLPGVLVGAVILAVIGIAYYQYWVNRPTSEAEIAHIESLIVAGKIDDARASMIDAQARSTDVSALRLRIGRAYLREGLIGPATSLLVQVESALIKEERLAIAEYFLVSGDPFSAVKFFDAALRTGLPRTASLLGRYGEALALSANGEGAVAAFRESLSMDGTKPRVRLNLALTLANLGRLDESRTEAQGVLKIEPQNAKARDLLAALNAPR